MRRFLAITLAALGLVATLSAGPATSTVSASADSCTVTGAGSNFALEITIPAGAPRQGGFVFEATGSSVSMVLIDGVSGSQSSLRLPHGATALAQTSQSALPPGIVSVNVQTQGDFSGVFHVTPEGFPKTSTFLAAFSCAVPPADLASNAFSPQGSFTWSSALGGWRENVRVPGPGVLSFHSTESNPLIASNGVVLQRGGVAALTIKPTPAGKAALARHRAIAVALTLVYTPNRGEPASKTITATLRAGP
jgi:hypothetical protein